MRKKFVKKIIKECKDKHSMMGLIKARPGASLVLGILTILLALTNPFVIGAILGGFLGVRKVEKNYKDHDFQDMPVIVALIIGSILGGLFTISVVGIGQSLFDKIGMFLGAVIGTSVTTLFAGYITERIVRELMSIQAFSNKTKLKVHAILKKTRKFL